jgi:PIN domain nuclease of toxin-antitoxin system
VADYVLDTHACLFALAAPQKLGSKARRALQQAPIQGSIVWVPAAVSAEIVMLKQLGRTDLGVPALRRACERTGWRFLALDFEQIDELAALGSIRDTFDRLIVAASRRTGAKLISRDSNLEELGLVDIVWA